MIQKKVVDARCQDGMVVVHKELLHFEWGKDALPVAGADIAPSSGK